MSARVAFDSEVVSWTLKVTRARVRSTISTFLTVPTLTPAIRMSSPLTTPVASLNSALYSRLVPKSRLPMVTTRTLVARVVTTMKIDQLDQVDGGALVECLHRSVTSAPRAIGPDEQHAEVGHLGLRSAPRPGPSSDLRMAASSRPPA